MANSYFSDGPITTTVNRSEFSPDIKFNGFAFDIEKGFFLDLEGKDERFNLPEQTDPRDDTQ